MAHDFLTLEAYTKAVLQCCGFLKPDTYKLQGAMGEAGKDIPTDMHLCIIKCYKQGDTIKVCATKTKRLYDRLVISGRLCPAAVHHRTDKPGKAC